MGSDLHEFDSDYGESKRRKRKKIAIVAIFLVIIALSVILIANLVNAFIMPTKDKTIYNLEQTLRNEAVADKASYVRIKSDQAFYVRMESGLVIYQKERKSESDSISWRILRTNSVIQKDGKVIDIDECSPNFKSGIDYLDCLAKDRTYIISEPDEAVIDEELFIKEYK